MMGETALCQTEKSEILYSLLFIYSSTCLNERLRAHTQLLEPSLGHLSGGAQTPTLEDPALCLELSLSRLGWALEPRAAFGCWLCNHLFLLQRCQSAVGKVQELPRERSHSVSWTNLMLLEVQMETRIPGKCLPPWLALISQGHGGGWVSSPFLGTSWALLIPQGSLPWAPALPHTSMAPAGSTPPALRSCFIHLNSFNIYSLYSLKTRMLQWIFQLKIFHYFLSSSPAIFLHSAKPLVNNATSLHLCLRYPGTN